jgi:hypothetical protein
VAGGPLQVQQQHLLIAHAAAAERGFDRRADRFDNADADSMIAVAGDASDVPSRSRSFEMPVRRIAVRSSCWRQ